MPQYPATIALSGLNGANGFQLNGEFSSEFSGRSVASAGDVNGDGFDDVIVGAPYATPNGRDSGAGFVVFGKASGFAAEIDLSSLDGTDGFRLDGAAANNISGRSVASAGDVNGDGFADLVIGAPGGDASYVVFGKASGFAVSLELSSLDGTDGFRIDCETAGDFSGASVASAGDVNGDGFADIIIGAPYAHPHGTRSGASYVVFGRASGFAADVNVSSLNGTNGFQISGEAARDDSGFAVAMAGDVNGDGFADIIVGAAHADPNGISSGASYVVFGKALGFAANIELSSLDGTNGFQISGEAASDLSGRSVASAGDVNGDGFADVIVGASHADPNADKAGASYVVFGKASGFGPNLDLSSLDGTDGFRITGEGIYDHSGGSVASAGDFNGDGFADLIVGAIRANGVGASYIVFGKASGFAASLDLSSLDGDSGIKIRGEAANDYAGNSVASAGDVNGDGFADVIVGAVGADPHGNSSGASYVVFGGEPGEAVRRDGTDIAQTIHGGHFDDILRGRGGDDRLIGHAGADRLDGGTGDDTLKGGAGADVLIGGSGRDVLIGGAADDTFVFTALAHSGADAALRDRIADFATGSDLLDLHRIDADTGLDGDQAFVFVGTAEFSHNAGELHERVVGGRTLVEGDVNGDGAADFQIELKGLLTLQAGDFVL